MWLGLSFSTCSTYDKKYKSFYRVNFLWMKTRSSFSKIISYFFILQWCDKQILVADVFLKIFRIFIKFCRWHCRPCQTSMMVFFVCVNYFQKKLYIDVWLGSKYASTFPSIINIFWVNCCMRIDKAENSKQCKIVTIIVEADHVIISLLYSFLPYLVTLCNKQTSKVIQLLNIWCATSLYRNELEICLLYL